MVVVWVYTCLVLKWINHKMKKRIRRGARAKADRGYLSVKLTLPISSAPGSFPNLDVAMLRQRAFVPVGSFTISNLVVCCLYPGDKRSMQDTAHLARMEQSLLSLNDQRTRFTKTFGPALSSMGKLAMCAGDSTNEHWWNGCQIGLVLQPV